MKPNLKRIEATLHQLPRLSTASHPKQNALINRTYSFEISSAAQKRNPPVQVSDVQQTSSEETLLPSNSELQSFHTQQSVHKEPTLPKFNPLLSSHHNSSNPNLEVKLMVKTQPDVASYKSQLQEIIHQIQETYMEGPLVDGWLESYPCVPEPMATLRHESVYMANYVEEVCIGQENVTCESPRTGYRLCGLDAAGQKWSRPCPLEQLPSISIAIARYQKLRQLLENKHHLERRLKET